MKEIKENSNRQNDGGRKPFWKELQALYLIGVDPFPYPFKRFIKRW